MNTLSRDFTTMSVLDFDYHYLRNGWVNIAMNAYQAYWKNDLTLQFYSYTEGDLTLTTCKDEQGYQKELKSIKIFIEENL